MFSIGSSILVVFTLGCAFAKGFYYVHYFLDVNDNPSTDVMTLDILRGFQGIGAAAQIPASVRLIYVTHPSDSIIHTGRYPRTLFPPVSSTVSRVCYLLCRCTDWGGFRSHHKRRHD